ncbi:MAG: hypothetical protein JRI25_22635 [Deltaproteobacteria bacterium]|nr:hypothetical protein [Deltaproteobacteria bacterium]
MTTRPGSRARLRASVLAAALTFATLGPTPSAWAAEGAAAEPASTTTATRHPRENTLMKRQWGIEVEYVRQTAGGYMLEFRYRVLDADKAMPLFDRQTKPVLIHAESGAELIVPTPAKVGALRNSNPPRDGQVFWMLFANPGALVKSDDHVSIQIGAFRVDGLVVQ